KGFAFSIALFDFAPIIARMAAAAFPLNLCGHRALLGFRFAVDALILQALATNPLIDAVTLQRTVFVNLPICPPLRQHLLVIPAPHLEAEPLMGETAHGEHHMGMVIAVISLPI